jgi:hypothetical protein
MRTVVSKVGIVEVPPLHEDQAEVRRQGLPRAPEGMSPEREELLGRHAAMAVERVDTSHLPLLALGFGGAPPGS